VDRYGLTVEEKAHLLKACGGLCMICRKAPSGRRGDTTLGVDHCHTTGHVRGLLCNACNNGLARFRDSPALLRSAAHYLEKVKL
jgi:hypothetical protein